MKVKVNLNRTGEHTYAIRTDPTKSFTHITQHDILNSLGLIPQIMFNPNHTQLNMWDALNAGYQHGGGLLTIKEATIGKDLSFNFPGDPPLMPIARYTRGSEVTYQYESGLMMIEKEGKLTATQMD